MHEASEFDKLLEIYNRYPITELTIHPRVRQDFYKGKVRESDFAAALPRCSMPVCYNGDLIIERDVSAVSERYPDLPAVMIGRALIADPSLVMRLTGGKAADAKCSRPSMIHCSCATAKPSVTAGLPCSA